MPVTVLLNRIPIDAEVQSERVFKFKPIDDDKSTAASSQPSELNNLMKKVDQLAGMYESKIQESQQETSNANQQLFNTLTDISKRIENIESQQQQQQQLHEQTEKNDLYILTQRDFTNHLRKRLAEEFPDSKNKQYLIMKKRTITS